ncbi:CRISPR-associated endoribonuclease Cas6 [Clostridium neuense]|uniref:CRISPR-associated endoribonuclease Cas6 n=1 Tax=Clostridium neuense TaxID=1728934 RepID=A0ABW8TL84_9CLOT
MLKVYEISIKTYLLESIEEKDVLQSIAELIDKSFIKNSELAEFHETNAYKKYVFNALYPIEKNKIYFKGRIYSFQIRTVDEKLCSHFEKVLVNEYTDKIKVLTVQKRVVPRRCIEKLYSITTCIEKFEDGYWKSNHSVEEFEKRLTDNLIKKYIRATGKKLSEDVEIFNLIEFNNKKPISVNYKNVKLLGDKVTLYVANNSIAQELSYFALGVGVLEMNARGNGYVNYKLM